MRLQIHTGRSVRLFSKRAHDITSDLHELVKYIQAQIQPDSIVEGELVAVDATGRPLPFQRVLNRGDHTTRYKIFLFDVLLNDGVSLVDQSLVTRKMSLSKVLRSTI